MLPAVCTNTKFPSSITLKGSAGGGENSHDYHKVVVLLAGDIPRIAYVPPWHIASPLVMYDVD